jgi:hypothetical protein
MAVALLAGCASAPLSSVHDGARPNHRIDNGDGTTTFEFVFPNDDTWDRNMARQRIDEYLSTCSRLNGFAGYKVISSAIQLLSKVNRTSAALDILQDAASGEAPMPGPGQAKFVRVIEQVKFES